ncbi:hypothetical protein Dvina_51525 [Dactylosporangium vinaceum]|uniref:YCII-related domain-containing protein n=1 Tax=Dactylosporangium vinaceum TaxID=53362 RepID=A0ABV5M2H3_9ACTN|nr:hypothetical protein [Dactylosporangium vinaceum]UAB96278.1 hypothetical protein Dvina_51525 [Dactylosporangium vinaceum]
MGTWAFETYADGEDASTAFNTARSDAAFEHGHGGYSGTIAEKDSYVVITYTITDLDEAERLAGTLMENDDPRIADKWGPAGAIPVRQPTRTVRVDDLTGSGTSYLLDPAELDRITGIARTRGLITPGETVTAGHLITATRNRAGRRPGYTGGVAELTVRRSPADLQAQTRPDGWLFFGLASC